MDSNNWPSKSSTPKKKMSMIEGDAFPSESDSTGKKRHTDSSELSFIKPPPLDPPMIPREFKPGYYYDTSKIPVDDKLKLEELHENSFGVPMSKGRREKRRGKSREKSQENRKLQRKNKVDPFDVNDDQHFVLQQHGFNAGGEMMKKNDGVHTFIDMPEKPSRRPRFVKDVPRGDARRTSLVTMRNTKKVTLTFNNMTFSVWEGKGKKKSLSTFNFLFVLNHLINF